MIYCSSYFQNGSTWHPGHYWTYFIIPDWEVSTVKRERAAQKTEMPRENVPQYHVVHLKSYMIRPGNVPRSSRGKRATNYLSIIGTRHSDPTRELLQEKSKFLINAFFLQLQTRE
jgi:hypothetical protein